MEGLLDIYTKLIIAIISFIAPVIVFMLGIFTEGIPIVSRRSEEESRQIRKLLGLSFSNQKTNSKILEKSIKQLKKVESKNSRRIKLLTPGRQIYRIFSSLLLALLLMMCYHVVKDVSFDIYNHWLAVSLLIGSFISFILGGLILRQIAWAVIDTKQIIAAEKSAEPIRANDDETTDPKNDKTISA